MHPPSSSQWTCATGDSRALTPPFSIQNGSTPQRSRALALPSPMFKPRPGVSPPYSKPPPPPGVAIQDPYPPPLSQPLPPPPVETSQISKPRGSTDASGLLPTYAYRFQLCGFVISAAARPAGSGEIHRPDAGWYSRNRKSCRPVTVSWF